MKASSRDAECLRGELRLIAQFNLRATCIAQLSRAGVFTVAGGIADLWAQLHGHGLHALARR